jgi:hypothetical protein
MQKGQLAKLISALSIILTFAGCGKGESTSATTETPQNTSKQSASTKTASVALALLSPEQLSKIFKSRLNYQTGWTDGKGVFHDAIVETFAVSLGGVDFENAFERDPSPKVQTILVSRTIAWRAAAEFVWWESDPVAAKKTDRQRVLTIADLKTDFPAEAADSFKSAKDLKGRDERWRNQLVALYWKLLARPPSTVEIQLCANAFAATMKSQSWPPLGWQIIVYSLLSTSEFWTLGGSQ